MKMERFIIVLVLSVFSFYILQATLLRNSSSSQNENNINSRKVKIGEEKELSIQVSHAFKYLPEWIKKYMKWHAEQRRNNFQNNKFLVVTCKKDIPCGGISDRLRSVPYFLVAANEMNRVILIKWQRFELENFLLPPMGGVDWRIPFNDMKVEAPHRQTSCKRYNGPAKCKETWENEILSDKKFVFVNAREDLYGDYESDFFTTNRAPHGLFRSILDIFFEPVPELSNLIYNTTLQLGLKERRYASAHFRYIYPSRKNTPGRMPNDLRKSIVVNAINCAVSISRTLKSPIYLASDLKENVRYAIEESPYAAKYNPPVKVVGLLDLNRDNIDKNNADYDHPHLYYHAFVDLWLLRNSRCVAYGDGGYGIFGARFSGNKCVIQHQKTFSWNMSKCEPLWNYTSAF